MFKVLQYVVEHLQERVVVVHHLLQRVPSLWVVAEFVSVVVAVLSVQFMEPVVAQIAEAELVVPLHTNRVRVAMQ